MVFIFKVLFIALQFIFDFCMVIAAMRSFHESRKSGISSADVKRYKASFTRCFILGIIVKLLYWLLIVGSNKMITAMFYADGLACAIVLVMSFVYMLPLNKIVKGYGKGSLGLSISWIIKVAVAVLVLFLEAYVMAAPVIV